VCTLEFTHRLWSQHSHAVRRIHDSTPPPSTSCPFYLAAWRSRRIFHLLESTQCGCGRGNMVSLRTILLVLNWCTSLSSPSAKATISAQERERRTKILVAFYEQYDPSKVSKVPRFVKLDWRKVNSKLKESYGVEPDPATSEICEAPPLQKRVLVVLPRAGLGNRLRVVHA